MITAKRNDRNITRNASHFNQIKLEPGIVVIDSDNDDDVYSPTITDTLAIPANARDVRAHAETAPSDASYAEPEATRSNASPGETTPEPRRSSRPKKTPARLDIYELAK
ncbi:hypothetical protein LSAT2_032087, partial [Lamellibrachia satsuma]